MINLSDKENLRKIRWALLAMSRDGTKPSINQLLIGPDLVATDGHRVHFVELPELKGADSCELPSEVALALPILAANTKPCTYNTHGVFRGERWSVHTSTGIPHPFPPWPSAIRSAESDASTVMVRVKELRDAINTISKRWDAIVLRVDSNDVLKVDVPYEGDHSALEVTSLKTHNPEPKTVAAAINRKYLLDAIKYLPGEATLHFGAEPTDQLRITCGPYTAAIMPMRCTKKELGI